MKSKLYRFIIFLGFITTIFTACSSEPDPIRIGVLHSLTGTMAISESPVVDGILMAVDEINASGGVLGRQIDPIVVDIQSNDQVAISEAQELFDEGVNIVFGCWTSSCRRSVRPLFEENNGLLFYSIQFEGLEQSPNVVYVGATPNQQILPTVQWAYATIGTRFFLIGSDYIFPHAANAIIIDKLDQLGGEVVGEEYVLLGSSELDDTVQSIIDTQPDVIINTINGDSNIAFFEALRTRGITSDDIPTISFSISESELTGFSSNLVVGDYAAWNYFQSLESNRNTDFTASFHQRYGDDRPIGDPIQTAYLSVYMWAAAAESAGNTTTDGIIQGLSNRTFNSPQGTVRMDVSNQHLWKATRVGQIQSDGQFDIVWDSGLLIRPEPYPLTRSVSDWNTFLDMLYEQWDGNWINSGNTD